MNFKKRVNGSWTDTSHYIMGTDTDTITTLPADLYPNNTTATVGLKGNMQQNSTPSQSSPIYPAECGDKTANLWNEEGFSARAIPSTHEHTDTNTYGTTLSTTIGKETIITQSEYPTGTVGYQNGFFFIDVDFSKYEIGDKVTLSFDYICNEVHSIESQVSTTLYAGKNSNSIPVVLSSGKWSVSGRLTAVITVIADMNPYVEVRLCGNSITVKNIMLNLGSTALPFEPFGVKIPILNNSQTTNVYLGEVQSTRKIKKLVLTGEEDWTYRQGEPSNVFFLETTGLNAVDNHGLCTHYLNQDSGSFDVLQDKHFLIKLSSTLPKWFLGVRDTNFGLPDLKAFLAAQYAAGTPVTIWYVLATPETAVVNEPIRKIDDYADEVSSITIPTIAGANTISVDTTLQPSEVTVKYKGWHKASEIVHRYQYGEWDGSPAPTYPVYGFKIDKNNDDPDTRVTYLYDAEGMTPAYMDFSNGTFNYGSWADAWFIKNNRPVALKFDGTVDYELNHTDFTKKLDGTASDVEDANYAGNFMSEMPTVYVKRWEDNDYNYMAFCEVPYDEDFLAQAHTNANGDINNYIYLPMFKGSIDANDKLRSLMGTIPNGNTTGTNEVTYVSNCGTGWQLWDKAKIDLIMDLIVLITKSTNCRAKIGNGGCQTYNASDTRKDSKNKGANGKMMSGYEVGDSTRSANAQFYGTEGTDSTGYGMHHMIAFYIEDLWANRWDRCLGFNLVNNVYKVKMTPPYVLDSDSTYQTLDIAPPSSTESWLKNVSSGVYGDVPTVVGATTTTGFANYFYKNASGSRLSMFGGNDDSGLQVGRSWRLSDGSSRSSWVIGGSPCYNSPTQH